VVIGIKIKRIFFNRRRVMSAMDRARRRYLYRAAAYVRAVARNSLGRRSGKKSKPSPPGHPPRSAGRLRKSIFYAVQPHSVIIGPSADIIGEVGAVHEYGGKFRGATYPARPYMGPALEKSKDKLPAIWRDSVI
jgi:phage gpG-like protein